MHLTRNLFGQVAKSKRAEVAEGLRKEFAAPTRTQALGEARRLVRHWRASAPRVAATLAEELEDCLSRLAFPLEHQARTRTTNSMERLSQALKRRTREVRAFPNREASLRQVTALAM